MAGASIVAGVVASGGAPHTQVPVIPPPADGLPAAAGGPSRPTALAVGSGGRLYIADPERDQILERLNDGRFFVVAGTGQRGFAGDGGPAVQAELDDPSGMTVSPDGTLYFADQGNHRVRSVSRRGVIRTVAGGGSSNVSGYVLTGTAATQARIVPCDVTVGPRGRLYIATDDQVLRLDTDGSLTAVVGAQGPQGVYGLGGPAVAGSADGPTGIAFDSAGNLYVTGFNTKSLLMVTPGGTLTQPGGTQQLYPRGYGGVVSAPDGSVVAMDVLSVLSIGPRTTRTIIRFDEARLHGIRGFSPDGLAVGPDGTIYVDTFYGNGYTDRTAIAAVAPGGMSSRILWEGAPPPAPGTSTTATGAPSPNAAPLLLEGDGIATVHFGQDQATAVADLQANLGAPGSQTANTGPSDCGIDTDVQWTSLTAFFYLGRFVGYSTLAANGETLPAGNMATAAGLRFGDTLARARQLYGAALTTSFEQGGAWFAATSSGRLDGYLTAVPTQTNPPARIASIEAGSVGCPAASP